MNIEGIIFDFGGTLDSRGEHWYHVMARAYADEGLVLSREAYIYGERNITPLVTPGDTMLDLLRKKVGLQLSHRGPDLTAADRIARKCYGDSTECIGELRPGLTRLSRRYPLAIVSNFYGNLASVLRDYGILHLFSVVVDSAVAGVRKPDPAIFRLGIDLLGLSPARVLVIGDSADKDIVPAASLGCMTALVEGKPWEENSPTPSIPGDTVRIASLSRYLDTLRPTQ